MAEEQVAGRGWALALPLGAETVSRSAGHAARPASAGDPLIYSEVTLEHRIAFTVRSDLTTRSLNASLKGFGSPPTPAEIVVETLTVSQRLRRAAVALGLAAALALVALPIPLVHFVLVPAALLLGLIFAALRLNQREIIRSAEGSCPYCSTHQRLGLAGRVFRLPREVFCSRCGRPLDLDRD